MSHSVLNSLTSVQCDCTLQDVSFPKTEQFSHQDTSFSPARIEQSSLTVAAIGDLHLSGTAADEAVVRSVMDAASEADVLAVCGDLTCHGRPEEVRAFAQAIGSFAGTVITVLGNHDHESDRASSWSTSSKQMVPSYWTAMESCSRASASLA